MSSASLAYTGRILILAGGLLLVVLSVLGLLKLAFTIPFRSPLDDVKILGRGFEIVALILGVVARAVVIKKT